MYGLCPGCEAFWCTSPTSEQPPGAGFYALTLQWLNGRAGVESEGGIPEMVQEAMSFDPAVNHGHVPVMRDRMADLLAPAVAKFDADAVLVDGTLGAGGHTEHFLRVFPKARVIGVDRDPLALEQATKRLAPFGERFIPVQARFDEIGRVCAEDSREVFDVVREHGVAGALFDLGVSSMQLDQEDRGFAYKVDAPLDMRMDPTTGVTAADVLNTYDHGALARVLSRYGEERFAGKIATAVLKEREKAPFTTSARLVDLLYDTIPAATRRRGGHPAKRTFQALRIEVNAELEAVEQVVPVITELLGVGGRVVFMSYQSLEDKIIKREFKELTRSKTPQGLPMDLPGTAARFASITNGAEKASAEEIALNSRAAPVRVRGVEKLTSIAQSTC